MKKRPSALAVYVTACVALGVAIAVLTAQGTDLLRLIHDTPEPVWFLLAGLLLGELTPIPVARGDDEKSDVTMSTTFAVALVVTGPFALLLLVHSLAVALDDIRT